LVTIILKPVPHERQLAIKVILSIYCSSAFLLLIRIIYYRLLMAPSEWWDGSETLRVRGSTREAVSTTAWAELVNWLRVSPEEAQKALNWLNEKKVIHYFLHQGGREIEISFEGLYFPE
jgi:hypothetical protein